MTFLPIVERELRVAARRPWTHGLRFLAALSVIGVGLVVVVANQGSMAPPYVGRVLFRTVSILGFGLVLFAGMFLTADCLCSEKRDGTLGLLFLTDLKGYDVVLGKLAATSMVSIYALLAIVPMLGLPLLMGGVSAGEFGRTVLVLMNTLFFSLAAGMFASALYRDTREAMLASFGLMLFLNGVLFLLAWCADAIFKGKSLNVLLLLPSPLLAFLQAADSGGTSRLGFSPYWASIGIVAGLAWLQLALAILVLPRAWQEKNLQTRPADRTRPRLRVLAGRLALDPFLWLATREKFPGRSRAVMLGLLFVLWWVLYIASVLLPRRAGADQYLLFCLFLAYGLHVVVKVLVATQASHRLCEDFRTGALELLLVTPVTPEEILEGQWRALKLQFKGLVRMLWAMNSALFLLFAIIDPFGMPADVRWTFGLFVLGGALLLPLDFNALGWTGMAEAMAGRRHHRALLGALARIMAPPVLVTGLVVLIGAGSGLSTGGVNAIHLLWFCVGLVTSRGTAANRKAILRQHFRRLASGEIRKPKVDTPSPGFYWMPEPTVPPRPSA